jgi:hypothetical protein
MSVYFLKGDVRLVELMEDTVAATAVNEQRTVWSLEIETCVVTSCAHRIACAEHGEFGHFIPWILL